SPTRGRWTASWHLPPQATGHPVISRSSSSARPPESTSCTFLTKAAGRRSPSPWGGQVQALFSIALAAMPHVEAGRIHALGISSAKRSAVAPELPTVAEAGGMPGFEVIGWFGWLAPAGTPPTIVQRLNKELVAALEASDVRDRLLNQSTEPVGNTSAEFG